MTLRLAAVAAAAWAAMACLTPAHAMSMADCSAKYKSARTAGTLNGQTWNDFRKAQCSDSADAADSNAPATVADAKPQPAAAPAAPLANVVFPSAVDPKFSSEKPTQARMHTCLAQYKIDKANNGLGGLKWVQKGGGYYSLCNKKLKG
jgi:hypothetical protein